MSKLKHYKGDNWEVKVKYDADMRAMVHSILWLAKKIPNHKGLGLIDYLNEVLYINKPESFGEWYLKRCSNNEYRELIRELNTLTAPKIINELSYDTVVKELEGLEGFEYIKQVEQYEFNEGHINYANGTIEFDEHQWNNLKWFKPIVTTTHFTRVIILDLSGLKEAVERGLIKLRRVKWIQR